MLALLMITAAAASSCTSPTTCQLSISLYSVMTGTCSPLAAAGARELHQYCTVTEFQNPGPATQPRTVLVVSHPCLFPAAVVPFQNFPTTQVTFVAWVRMSYLNDDPGTLVGFGTPTLVNGVAFLVSSINGALVAKIGGNTYYGDSVDILDDSWHMLSMSWKASTGTVKFYVDETLFQSLSFVYSGEMPASTGCLSVGRRGTASCSTSTGFPSYASSYSQEIGQVRGAGGRRGRADANLFAVLLGRCGWSTVFV